MCKLKSALILKNRIFMPDYDSHSDMLKELGMEDDYLNASNTFVRAELSPKYGDPFSDIDTWEFHVDQDITPDWFDNTKAESEMRDAVKEWAKTHIFIGVDGLSLTDGAGYYIKDCKNVEISGSASVKYIRGSSSVDSICGSARVEYIGDSVRVENIFDSSRVDNISDSSSVGYIGGSARVECICGSARVDSIYGSASAKCISGSARVYSISGSASVANISGSARVEVICGSASVESICDSASAKCICGYARVDSIYGYASVGSISGSARVNNISGSVSVCTGELKKWDNLHDTLLRDNATIKDNYNKTIYQAGDWKMKAVKDGKIR